MIFLSYRKLDSIADAGRLKLIFDQVFGTGAAFLDNYSIDYGEKWPEKLAFELSRATVLIIIIGPQWLKASDIYGYRLLDKPDDWVRTEIEYAIKNEIEIIPILVANGKMPPVEALPESIKKICSLQPYELREAYWKTDISALNKRLEKLFSFETNLTNIQFPENCDHVSRLLTPEELTKRLSELKGWTIENADVPNKKDEKGNELVKKFEFITFQDAIKFMSEAAVYIDKVNHHPKWENLWINLIVHLSTWNIGYKISALDFDLAFYLDNLYEASYKQPSGEKLLL